MAGKNVEDQCLLYLFEESRSEEKHKLALRFAKLEIEKEREVAF